MRTGSLLLGFTSGEVGDACTYPEFCLSQLCSDSLVQGPGVCTQTCVVGLEGACPMGLTCVDTGGNGVCYPVEETGRSAARPRAARRGRRSCSPASCSACSSSAGGAVHPRARVGRSDRRPRERRVAAHQGRPRRSVGHDRARAGRERDLLQSLCRRLLDQEGRLRRRARPQLDRARRSRGRGVHAPGVRVG